MLFLLVIDRILRTCKEQGFLQARDPKERTLLSQQHNLDFAEVKTSSTYHHAQDKVQAVVVASKMADLNLKNLSGTNVMFTNQSSGEMRH